MFYYKIPPYLTLRGELSGVMPIVFFSKIAILQQIQHMLYLLIEAIDAYMRQ